MAARKTPITTLFVLFSRPCFHPISQISKVPKLQYNQRVKFQASNWAKIQFGRQHFVNKIQFTGVPNLAVVHSCLLSPSDCTLIPKCKVSAPPPTGMHLAYEMRLKTSRLRSRQCNIAWRLLQVRGKQGQLGGASIWQSGCLSMDTLLLISMLLGWGLQGTWGEQALTLSDNLCGLQECAWGWGNK